LPQSQRQHFPRTGSLPRSGFYKQQRSLRDAVAEHEKQHGQGSAQMDGDSGTRAFQGSAARPRQPMLLPPAVAVESQQRRQPDRGGRRLVDGISLASIGRHMMPHFSAGSATSVGGTARFGAQGQRGIGAWMRMPRH
jgi:hypothetical protein